MYKGILFDLDGVLTTDATGTTSIIKYFASVLDIDKEQFKTAYRKHNDDLLYGRKLHTEIWDEVCKDMDMKIDIQVLYDSFVNTPLDMEMYNLAKWLKSNGYKVALVTDNKRDRIDYLNKLHGFDDVFDVIKVSSDIGSGKKNKEIFDETLDVIDLKFEECIMIDNNEKNLVVPRENGMIGIYYDHDLRNFKKLTDELSLHGVL